MLCRNVLVKSCYYLIIHSLGTRIYAMLLRPPDTKSHIKGLRPYAGLLNECFPVNLCLIEKDMKLILILKTLHNTLWRLLISLNDNMQTHVYK